MILRPSALRRFRRDHRGIAMVEFALLAPVLILFYVGLVELCQGLMAERRTSHAASAVGDLVAQAATVNASDVNSIFNIAGDILAPFPVDGADHELRLRITSVKVNASGDAKVVWTQNRNWAADDSLTAGATVALPQVEGAGGTTSTFLAPGESAVMAETYYEFSTPVSEIFSDVLQLLGVESATDGGFDFRGKYFLRPRRSEEVVFKTT